MRYMFGVFCLTLMACVSGQSAPQEVPLPAGDDTNAWLLAQELWCGEVRGRVIDMDTRRPLSRAIVTIDGTAIRPVVDEAGVFHIRRIPDQPTPATLRVDFQRRQATMEIPRANVAYVVEIGLAGFHGGGGSTVVHVRHPGRCRVPAPVRVPPNER